MHQIIRHPCVAREKVIDETPHCYPQVYPLIYGVIIIKKQASKIYVKWRESYVKG